MKKDRIHNVDKTGFKVPKDYFKNLEDDIINDLKLREHITAPGFKTPKGYFDTLEDSIIEKVSKKESPKVISLFTRKNIIYISSIAAAILLLFNLNIFDNNSSSTLDFNLDDETVENYMINESIDSYEIASLLEDDDFFDSDIVLQNFDDENVETFILNNLDIEDLIIE